MINKKELGYVITIIILVAGFAQQFYNKQVATPRVLNSSTYTAPQVFYNQETELNKKIIAEIQDADKYVYFAVYTFTRKDIRDALLAAKARGLDVKGITDKDQYAKLKSQTEIIDSLKNAGIPVEVQTHLGIMHLKVLVTDKAYASGSYNWTASATTLNDEVLETGTDPNIKNEFERIFLKMFDLYK
jgi:phosphatidylserine/phosphatidylglycerophosphate/cardiolipin synthase-like enzyme